MDRVLAVIRESGEEFRARWISRSQISVDLPHDMSWSCDPWKCGSLGMLCCSRYDVVLTGSEAQAIGQMLAYIARLPGTDKETLATGVFAQIDDMTFVLRRSKRQDSCVFLATDECGTPRCGIQLVACLLGIDYRGCKPLSCRLFPLELRWQPDSSIILSLHPDWRTLPCLLSRRYPGNDLKPLRTLADAEMGMLTDIGR